MPENMGKLIDEIDSLDVYRDKLHQLRDITLFYDRLYPELHIVQTPNSTKAENGTIPATAAPSTYKRRG